MAKRKGSPLALVLVLGACAALYYYYVNSPIFAVKSASDALRDHNLKQFQQYVDVHSVAKSAMNDLLADPIRKSGAGLLGRIIGVTIVSLFEPTSADAMEKEIDHWVEHRPQQPAAGSRQEGTASGADYDQDDDEPRSLVGELVAIVKPPSLREIFHDYGLTRKNFKGFRQTQQSDNDAHVVLDFNSPRTGGMVNVDLQLSKDSGHWQVVRVANLQDLVAKMPAP